MVYVPGFGQVDLVWDVQPWASFLERLASFTRLILLDRRGTGASDAIPDHAMPTWEEWADDLGAVLDWPSRANDPEFGSGAGEVLISRTVADLVVGSGIGLRDRGEHRLKGVPGRWHLFVVTM